MQCMKDWIGKVPNQRSIIQRLSKDSVKNHKNIRLAGEGGAPESQGSFAETEAHKFQHSLAQNIPGLAQATNLMNQFSGQGQGRDLPGSGYPGAGGQAASYYGGGDTSIPQPNAYGGVQPGYNPPSGPPAPSSYGAGPPSHAPPVPQRQGTGYTPSYAPSYDAPPSGSVPSFPGAGPSFPGADPAHPFPGADVHSPSFPGADAHSHAAPSFPGVAPSFPGAQDQGHGHHHGHGHGHGGYGPPPPGGPPGFPGASGGYGGPPPPGAQPPFGFPGADPYNAPPQFPGAQGGNNYYGGGAPPGGW